MGVVAWAATRTAVGATFGLRRLSDPCSLMCRFSLQCERRLRPTRRWRGRLARGVVSKGGDVIGVFALFVGVVVLLWPDAYRAARSWRDGTLYPGDDLVSVTVRRREKVIVVGTVVVSLILAVGLIGMAVVEWL